MSQPLTFLCMASYLKGIDMLYELKASAATVNAVRERQLHGWSARLLPSMKVFNRVSSNSLPLLTQHEGNWEDPDGRR